MVKFFKTVIIIMGLASIFQPFFTVNSQKTESSSFPKTQQCFFTVENSSLSHQMAKSETISHNFNQLPTFDFKYKFFSFHHLLTRKEHQNKANLSAYIDFSDLIYHRLQPYILIFPFNYFW